MFISALSYILSLSLSLSVPLSLVCLCLSLSIPVSLSLSLSLSQLALLVSQSRDSTGKLSGIKLSALDTGLLRVARLARRRKG